MEKRLFPLWLVNYAVSSVKGTELSMGYDEFLKNIFDENSKDTFTTVPEQKRTAEDIMDELMPFVEADQKKGG